jgi:prephenate dehydrogenase
MGLLGGSLGLAIRQRELARQVVGLVRRAAALTECEELQVVDSATQHLPTAVKDADLVVLCTPIGRMKQLAEDMRSSLKSGAVVTDVGSVKGLVVEELEPVVAEAEAHFVGSHPMAGSERTGMAAAHASLFVDACCVVTPTGRTDPTALELVRSFWQAVGARTIELAPGVHDDLVSRSSHLPHVVAAELANYVLSPVHPKEQSLLCATGFRDTTRIASGSPEMWRDIAMANRHHLSRVLGVFCEDLTELRRCLEEGDADAVQEFFSKAKERRDAWCNHGAATQE